ncbi:MAG TPA: DUF2490 domain-containing protein [Flavobacteriaceae bacterium]|nr:DUF2490 domain-containing protein [Flavobacteriaceae bacterium]HQU22153.1 DUF2490 domain-containing protein [Flavobacteriaceae bacterium]HQU64449.1 DUF2490 domain-containing protein [Flavobacteriaceae bacterium]HRW44580.1 DUF2490 domain-containing protein [Flavobacteriaceae bacterium]
MIKKFIIPLVLFCSIFPAVAQDRGEGHLGSWFMFFATHRVADHWSIHSEIQYRTYEFGQNLNQLLLRTGVNYHFDKNTSATLGYGYIPTDQTFEEIPGEKKLIEHRIFEQAVLKNKLGNLSLTHRYRLEHRFLKSPSGASDTQHRMRYLLRLTYPLSEKWFVSAYDELFVNLQEPIFGQNRLYGAIGYKFTPKLTAQVGYMKNHFTGINYDRFQLGFWWEIDWRKESVENKEG